MLSYKPVVALLGAVVAAIVAVTLLLTVHQSKGTMVLLIGKSGSEQPAEAAVRSCADAAIATAVDNGMTLYVAPVGHASSAVWKKVTTALSLAARSNAKRAKTERARATDHARAGVDAVLRGPAPAGASDLLTAASSAGRLLEQIHDKHAKTVVACADGHQVSKALNVYHDSLDRSAVQAVLEQMVGQLPDLGGVDVVIGAGGLDGVAEITPDREAAIQRFWTEDWAHAVHARSVSYDSVPHFEPAESTTK